MKKWFIIVIFIVLVSLPLFFYISNGKNGTNGVKKCDFQAGVSPNTLSDNKLFALAWVTDRLDNVKDLGVSSIRVSSPAWDKVLPNLNSPNDVRLQPFKNATEKGIPFTNQAANKSLKISTHPILIEAIE